MFKIIVVKIFGGLGNQMFQYAFGRCISIKNEEELLLDAEFLSLFSLARFQKLVDRRYIHRNLELSCFDLPIKKYVTKKIRKKFRPIFFDLKEFYLKFFIRNYSSSDIERYQISYKQNEYKFYKEKNNFQFDPNCFKNSENCLFNGYWQNEKYFKCIEKILRKDFNLPSLIPRKYNNYVKLIENSNSIAIHVRRGDYLLYNRTIGLNYYIKAINLIEEKIEKPRFFIFSDDIEWCKKNFNFDNKAHHYISPDSDRAVHDMALMSLCNNFIIANSSFSWWAAWLSDNSEKIVIAPKQWKNDYKFYSNGIIPMNWIQL